MANHSLAKIKLMANEFIQEYERQETEREFQKQRIKQNVMLEIMSNRNKSQSSQSKVRENELDASKIIDHNSRTLSANVSRAASSPEDFHQDNPSNASSERNSVYP